METLVNRTTADRSHPGFPRCRGLVLAHDRQAAQSHLARIDTVASHEGRSHEWHWVSLASLLPLLQSTGGPLPRLLAFEPETPAPAESADAPDHPIPPDLILCLDDDTLGLTGRLALLRLIREYLPDVPLLLLVRKIEAEDAVEALRAGATDLLAQRDWAALPLLVDRALRRASQQAHARATVRLSGQAQETLWQARLERERDGELRRLRASEEKYRSLFDHAPIPLAAVQSATGTLLLVNRALVALLHPAAVPPNPSPANPGGEALPVPFVGRHLSALFPPEAEAEADRLLLRLREEGGIVEGRYFLRQEAAHLETSPSSAPTPADHRPPLPVDLHAAPIPWGQSGAVVLAFRNAALREETGAGAALAYFALDRLGERSRGRGQTMGVTAGGEWVMWTDGEGHLLHANRPFCEALSRPLTLLRGRHISEIAPALGHAAWSLHRTEARDYGTFQIETTFQTRDGTLLSAEATAHALSLGGREYHCFIGWGAPGESPTP
ncbi:PAS domain-containing protein [Verrucomicrobium sp. GAS474]|uniref:PAS domain-containing protein n=1 Tax=Verrucomicrobium sp. GAS474 TaxID=1882831 RepID=UPI0008796A07|nr:PAS domain-containing protein [Verrucomicrobium sp. GAS474]SDT93321.1 PAS domain-containing protein [Verrucomicrobium sp. GAS474]